jgi:photosystem II stability/assembly factor-like uncharacterized protein
MRFFVFFMACLNLPIFFQAQPFIKNKTNRALTFKEIQLQFDRFRKNNDLKTAKYWKVYKRYEMEMLMHTNGRGEPDGFSTYIDEALKAAEEKDLARGGASPWSPVGPATLANNLIGYAETGIGRVNCVAFHPTDTNTYWVGVAQGGLWKTTNHGASYVPLTDNLPITRISDIKIDPNNLNTIYISVCDFEYIGKGLYLDGRKRHTHFGLGVYKSTNGGASWSATGLTFQLTNGDASLIRSIAINPQNSNELLACGVSGMYRSTNAGNTWIKQMDSLFWDMVQDPVNPNIIYAATGWVKNANLGSAAIYKSSNFGTSWTLLNTGIPYQGSIQRIKLAVAPSNPNYVYALCCDDLDGFYGIYQSVNGGNSWTFKPGQLNILEWDQGFSTGGQGTYDLALCVNSLNENLIYVGGINIWGSYDGGTSFNPVSYWTYQYGLSTIHADVHAIQKQPGSKNLFVSCDGGLYKSNNMDTSSWLFGWPTTWTNLSGGMQITSFYRLSSSKNSLDRLVAGAQDNSTFYKLGSSWSNIFGGDGMDNYLDPANPQDIIASSQYGNFFYSNDDGVNGSYISSNPNNESSEWVTPIVADYKHPGVLYIGNENVVKSTDGGQNWTPLGSIFTNTTTQENTEISALAVSPTNSNVIYAARRVRHEYNLKGIIIRSTNGGISFSKITNNLPDSLFYTGIEASPTNSNEAVVCMAGFAAGCKVFRTINGGASWANISFNLPNIPVNCIKYTEKAGQLLIATDLGIYYLNSGASSWVNYSLGLPNVIISDIELNPASNKVYISTFGRGIWETNLNMITALQPVGLADQISLSVPDFKLFPSTNRGQFTLEMADSEGTGNMEVIDVLGRIQYRAALSSKKTDFSITLVPGAYYVKIEQGPAVGVKKMVVE